MATKQTTNKTSAKSKDKTGTSKTTKKSNCPNCLHRTSASTRAKASTSLKASASNKTSARATSCKKQIKACN